MPARLAPGPTHTAPATERNPLARLRAIVSTINSGGSLPAMLERVLVSVCNGAPWSRGGIMAVNRSSGFSELVSGYAPGEPAAERTTTRWRLATSPVLRVVETRQPLVITDAQGAAEFAAYQADAIARGYRTVVLLPLGCTTNDEHEMVLSIHTEHRIDVTGEEIDFLTTVAHLAAVAVERMKHLRHEQRQTERLRRVLDAGSNLMELVLGGASLEATAGVIGTILPDPFVILDFVTDTTITRRSAAPDTLSEREWSALVEGAASHLLAALAHHVGSDGVAADGRLDLASVGLPLVLPVLTEPLRIDGETVGALLIFPRDPLLDGLDRVVTQEVRFAVGAQIMRSHAETRREAQDLSQFFDLLCRTGGADPVRAGARARRLGLDLARPVRLLAVVPPPLRGEPQLATLRRVLAMELTRAVPGAWAIEQGGAVAVGWPVANPAAALPTALLERHVLQPIRARWGAQPIIAAGPVCAAPGEYQAAWTQCGRVLHLARMFQRDGLLRQEDFGSFALLLSAFDGGTVRAFVDATLGPMRRHDTEHGGGLAETVAAFIDAACGYQATADRLGIHVSTLRYRLQRAEKLFGFDLTDAETRFKLSLAARLLAAGPAGSPPTHGAVET